MVGGVSRSRGAIAEGFVGNIHDHIIFLAGDGRFDIAAQPILGRTADVGGRRAFAVAGGVVYFEYTHQFVGLALVDHIGHIGAVIARPLGAITEYHAHRVSTGRGYIAQRLGQAVGVPGVGVVDSAKYKRVAIGVEHL